jgi:hypothetical protein
MLVRKVLSDGGQALGALLGELEPGLSEAGRGRSEQLRQITQSLVRASRQDAALPYAVADDYLRAVALVLMDWGWAQIASGFSTVFVLQKSTRNRVQAERWHRGRG